MAEDQNVNLLEEVKVHPTSALNGKLILQITIAWTIVLLLIYLLAVGTNSDKEKTLSQLKASQEKITLKIASYAKAPPTHEEGIDLKDLPIGSTNLIGFYRHLEDLAKLTPDGVWLKDITVSEPDDTIIIKGTTIIPFGASSLIKSLNKSEIFRNEKFGELQLQKNTKSRNFDFTISTIHSEAKEEPEKTEKK